MGTNELHSIEVALTYMNGLPVMLVQTAPTNDYDSGAEANAWGNRVATGKRFRAIAMTPVNGGDGQTDASVTPEARCLMDGCIFESTLHDGPHQDKAGELWDDVDVLGNRVVTSGGPETRKPA